VYTPEQDIPLHLQTALYYGPPKLQSEITLSTTKSEYISLSEAMRDAIPLKTILEELNQNLQISTQTNNDSLDSLQRQ
jgi:hypothetical protein